MYEQIKSIEKQLKRMKKEGLQDTKEYGIMCEQYMEMIMENIDV